MCRDTNLDGNTQHTPRKVGIGGRHVLYLGRDWRRLGALLVWPVVGPEFRVRRPAELNFADQFGINFSVAPTTEISNMKVASAKDALS